jgi:chromosome partitioning protein
MRITFLNQKGGVGKTTLVLLLSGVLRRVGYDVAIDDHDPQGTARLFAKKVDVPLYDPAKPAEYVITDTPGHLGIDGKGGGDLLQLVSASDKLVLVTEKSPAALHGSFPMAKLIVERKRPDAKAYVLFNRVRSGTTIGQQQGLDIAADLGLPALTVELPLSSAFENAFTDGLSAVTGKRRDELLSLALEVMK